MIMVPVIITEPVPDDQQAGEAGHNRSPRPTR
jgi:hypothetical protein